MIMTQMLYQLLKYYHSMKEHTQQMSLFQPKQKYTENHLEDLILTRIGVNVHRIFEIVLIIACCRIYRSSFSRI
jgi:hypothetical protein